MLMTTRAQTGPWAAAHGWPAPRPGDLVETIMLFLAA